MTDDALTLTLTDTDWHSVGKPETNWFIQAISGSAVDVIILPVGAIPVAATKAYFIIGGMLNGIRTKIGMQAWVRAQSGNATITKHDDSNEGFNETSHLRSMILSLQEKIAWLMSHAIEQDIWRANIIADWNLLKYTLTDRMDKITLSITKLMDMDVRLIDQLRYTRKRIPEILARLNALEATYVTQDDMEAALVNVLAAIAKNTDLSVDLLEKFVSLDLQLSKCRKDVNELMAFSNNEDLSTQIDTIQSNLDMYWELCIQLVNLPTVSDINTTYTQFLSEHTVPAEIASTLAFVKDQAIAIRESAVLDAEQETEIDALEEALNTPTVGTTVSAADMINILSGE